MVGQMFPSVYLQSIVLRPGGKYFASTVLLQYSPPFIGQGIIQKALNDFQSKEKKNYYLMQDLARYP
jgi:hypothetical protein